MRESLFETLVGAVVVAVAAAFAWFAIMRGGDASAGPDQYDLIARFNNVSGIERGSDVRIAGVKIGQVSAIGLDDDLRAEVSMEVDSKVALSVDSSAATTPGTPSITCSTRRLV